MSEPCRFEPHQPLDAVRHHALSTGLEPITHDEPAQFRRLANGMTPPATNDHAAPKQLRLEPVGHHTAAVTQRIARAPEIVPTDAVEHGVDPITGRAMDLLHEIHLLIVKR